MAQEEWQNPIQKQKRLGSPLVETSPFVFKDNLYLLENNQHFWDISGANPEDYFQKGEVRIQYFGPIETDQSPPSAIRR